MMEVYIEHNPYKPSTKILVDNELVKENSALNHGNQPFQEWVEELPTELRDECADNEFHITFHGTILDFEDLQSEPLPPRMMASISPVPMYLPRRFMIRKLLLMKSSRRLSTTNTLRN